MNQKVIYNDELKYMINEARYLSLDYERELQEMEWFARWNLPEEIGMSWIDAEGIINSDNLADAIPTETIQLLAEIVTNFEKAFEASEKNNVWTDEAMCCHPFWREQRKLAKQFLDAVINDEMLLNKIIIEKTGGLK